MGAQVGKMGHCHDLGIRESKKNAINVCSPWSPNSKMGEIRSPQKSPGIWRLRSLETVTNEAQSHFRPRAKQGRLEGMEGRPRD